MSNKSDFLTLKGVRENNLKNLDLDLPHDKFICITGLSGSGKSSLAFSTIYAEGQRRYVETFSPYTRQFLDKVKHPAIDYSAHVRPAIAIQQKTRVTNSRSTVASITNSHELLKLLWSNFSKPVNPETGKELIKWTNLEIAEDCQKNLKNFSSLLIVSPIKFPKENLKSAINAKIEQLTSLGFSRFICQNSGEPCRFEEEKVVPDKNQEVLVLIDRFKSDSVNKKRLLDSIDQALNLSLGTCQIKYRNDKEEKVINYHTFFCDPTDDSNTELFVPVPRPGLFDYNSPIGACPECRGFGKTLTPDPELIIKEPTKSIEDGAISCWSGETKMRPVIKLIAFCQEHSIPIDKPWNKLNEKQRDLVLNTSSRKYTGPIPWLNDLQRKSYKMHVRVFLSRFRTQVDCKLCQGSRFNLEVNKFRILGKSLPEIYLVSFDELLPWLEEFIKLNDKTIKSHKDLWFIVHSLHERLKVFYDLGLPYLNFGRQSRTLSGGETQRVNLAAALGSDLVSTQFVLDEPSVGLHPRDTQKLIKSLRTLQEKGNSVLVVEHDLDCIKAADHIIELGPGAGELGGDIIFNDTSDKWPGLKTGGQKQLKNGESKAFLEISNASSRNLTGLNCKFPIGQFSVLTGVSGSGKSTLVSEVILKEYENLKSQVRKNSKNNIVDGLQLFDQVLLIDQSGLAKSPRANIATYSGIWDRVRILLASTEAAGSRSLTKSSFSFNVDGGRCPECKGAGYIKEDMQFLSDVFIQCELCLGKRFQQSVLEVKIKGLNADELLNSTVNACSDIFFDEPNIFNPCQTLIKLGLGHIRLGHPLSEISGGEAQRLKLVPYISKVIESKSLIIFDEPSTGLHLYDVKNLLLVFQELINNGHTVICVEHNQEIILNADWIVDLGPEGGCNGGKLILMGTPGEFLLKKNNKKGFTAKYLQEYQNSNSSNATKNKVTKPSNSRTKPPVIIKGAKEHNLKNINIDIPHDQVVALTGVSGSGKSTIAKDIVFAEGQRRYLDCLSPYARQFIRELNKPNIDEIHNVRPSICVHQHTFNPGTLSTLGTVSEVYNFLRLVYAKVAEQYCPKHPEQKVNSLSREELMCKLREFGSKTIRLLAPIIKAKKGHHRAVFAQARSRDIDEVRVDGIIAGVGKFEEGLERHKVHNIDFVWGKFVPARIPDQLLTSAIDEVMAISGGSLIAIVDGEEFVFNRERACQICGQGFFKPDPEDLSFNSRRGRCQKCQGTGRTKNEQLCTACQGSGLSEIGQNLRLDKLNIFELSQLSVLKVKEYFNKKKWSTTELTILETVLSEIDKRLETLIALGLGDIPLSRSCNTLSTGELQRLRLSAAMGTPLSGSMYIFDEPTAGLHPQDNQNVLSQIRTLQIAGNSVLIIEHDESSILASDHVIELGPGAGKEGGRICFNDSVSAYKKYQKSQVIEWPECSSPVTATDKLNLTQIAFRNLKFETAEIPLKSLVSVIGVSGAGKSSLVNNALLNTIEPARGKKNTSWKSALAEIESSIAIDRVIVVDQSAIGRNSRSTPASYLDLWTHIRTLFAATIEAKSRGWNSSFFSYNSGKGRCQTCMGLGEQKLEMSFLSEARILCEDCLGKRFGEQALSVYYLNKNVNDVLNLTFEEARQTFSKHPKIHRCLHEACEIGLGYLTLGQSSVTLSGGESQRLKLVAELSKKPTGHNLYVLDEPTRGLHKKDVALLLKMLRRLIALGNSVILIEHDHDVLRNSDYLIELGPGAGENGGKLIFEGTPDQIKGQKTPWGKLLSSLES